MRCDVYDVSLATEYDVKRGVVMLSGVGGGGGGETSDKVWRYSF